MTLSDVVRVAGAVTIVVCITAQSASVQAQQRGGTPQTEKLQPVNTGDNPYRVIRDWARLDLENRPWGGSNGVAIDRDGKSVWGDRPMLAWNDTGLSRQQREPCPPF